MIRGRSMAALALLVATTLQARAELVTVADFGDILSWTGSGANEAVLVLQFPTAGSGGTATPAAIAWGYRWNGSATMADMVFAVAGTITGGPTPVEGADARLAIAVTDWGVAPATDYFLDSITYDQSGLPAGWSQGSREMPGWDGTNWIVLYTLPGTGGWTGDPFALSNVGMSSIALADGDWYGFVQTDGPEEFAFAQPVSAVPEPATWTMLLGAAGAAMAMARRRSRRT